MVYSVASVSSLLFLFLSEVVDWMMPDPGAVNQIRSVSGNTRTRMADSVSDMGNFYPATGSGILNITFYLIFRPQILDSALNRLSNTSQEWEKVHLEQENVNIHQNSIILKPTPRLFAGFLHTMSMQVESLLVRVSPTLSNPIMLVKYRPWVRGSWLLLLSRVFKEILSVSGYGFWEYFQGVL